MIMSWVKTVFCTIGNVISSGDVFLLSVIVIFISKNVESVVEAHCHLLVEIIC